MKKNGNVKCVDSRSILNSKHLLKRTCTKNEAIKHYCNFCEKSYTEKHNLTKHIKNKHTVNENVTCSKCGKTFQQKSSLTRHTKICVAE